MEVVRDSVPYVTVHSLLETGADHGYYGLGGSSTTLPIDRTGE